MRCTISNNLSDLRQNHKLWGRKEMQAKNASEQDSLNNYGGWPMKSNVCTTWGVYIHSLALEETTWFSGGSAGVQLFKARKLCVFSSSENQHWPVIHRWLERVIVTAQVGKLQWSMTVYHEIVSSERQKGSSKLIDVFYNLYPCM